jgi:hypothetical protein
LKGNYRGQAVLDFCVEIAKKFHMIWTKMGEEKFE